MARVLVTGATGFLGRFVPGILASRGHEVHITGRQVEETEWPAPLPSNCTLHCADLCASGAARELLPRIKPTHLLHLAWYAEPGKFWTSQQNIRWVAASLELFEAFVESGGQRFVGAGTCAEYDWKFDTLSPDNTPLNPTMLYGSAKARLYQLLSAASQEAGISFAWGRIFFPFGPWEHPARLLPQVISGLIGGTPVALSAGTQIRDFVYSEDVALMFADLVDSPTAGAVNIASGRAMSVRSFVELTLRHFDDAELLQFGKRPAGVDDTPYMIADMSGAGAIAPRIGIEEGVARTVAWWRSRTSR
jgi:nucleoside-diphosphate-sugar epimerase